MPRYRYLGIFLCPVVFFWSCQKSPDSSISESQMEAIEDSIALAEAYEKQARISLSIPVILETDPVQSLSGEDAADDPAIWISPQNPDRSLVFGSNKKGGILSFDLSGRQVDYFELGNINNIEVIHGVSCDGRIDLLGATNRSKQSLDVFKVDSLGKLTSLTSVQMDSSKMDDIYGFCFARDSSGREFAICNAKNGRVQQYEMVCDQDEVRLVLTRELELESQVEGMVYSAVSNGLYIGEEDKGIWMVDISPDSTRMTRIPNSGEENPHISYDVEGLTILSDDQREWLIASSQGNFSYAVFDIERNHEYLGSFVLSANGDVDGVEETDGLEVTREFLGPQFANGLLVVQDGFNYNTSGNLENQNFKLIQVDTLMYLFSGIR